MASDSVGKETLSYCTSCKMDLAHIISSMKGEKISKVECKTCKKTHVYRAPKGITEPPVKKAKKAKKKKVSAKAGAVTVEVEWERLMLSSKDLPMQKYNMKGKFQMGDKLSHSKFGEGVVGKLIFPNKLEVVFKDDIKILIHAGPPEPRPEDQA